MGYVVENRVVLPVMKKDHESFVFDDSFFVR